MQGRASDHSEAYFLQRTQDIPEARKSSTTCGKQVRHVKDKQEISLQYDNPYTFSFPEFNRSGHLLQMWLRQV